MDQASFDVFIIGGGINGCGIARDAAGRGYSVGLAEMNDLASGTSSWSTKLIHGGLRYLEFYEFRLVREALLEREVLWSMAPHIIWPLRFILPHAKGMRPGWMLRLGLFLYDNLGGRKALPGTSVVDLRRGPFGAALQPGLVTKGFEYSDCWVDDARLVILNAMDAARLGADIRVRTKVVEARREKGHWIITLEDQATDERSTIEARVLVNAGGPWVDKVLAGAIGQNKPANVRLVQGSHLVIKRKYEHDRAFIFQNEDGRIFFTIPYEGDFTLVGTTDHDFDGDPGDAKISKTETEYLLESASAYFKEPVTADDIVWTYSGVRPLYDDGASKAQEATRDYVLKVEGSPEDGQLLNIFGGKITTYRRLSESMLERIESALGPKGPAWTAGASLPGGNFPIQGRDALIARLQADFPFLDEGQADRLIRLYGTQARTILDGAETKADLGCDFGAGLSQAEVSYLMKHEWARTAEDVLWRRTKLGLRLTREETQKLDTWMQANPVNKETRAA
ncbi:MAG: glycerol-3-phosphate dehydrogenase [Magnetovibrionaceae bacterium]